MQEDVPVNPGKPTAARAPVLVPRSRPGPVTLAVLILAAEVALGLLSGGVLLIAAMTVPAAFVDRAAAAASSAQGGFGGVSPAETANIDAISTAIRAVLLGAAVVTLLLSVAAAALVRAGGPGKLVGPTGRVRARRGGRLRRAGQHVVHRVRSTGGLGRRGRARRIGSAASVGQAYGDAMPSVLVGAVGGLTDLQVLGYIAVSVLLALPVVRPYFRRATAQSSNGA